MKSDSTFLTKEQLVVMLEMIEANEDRGVELHILGDDGPRDGLMTKMVVALGIDVGHHRMIKGDGTWWGSEEEQQ